MQEITPNIFEKLPEGIFRPLASTNQRLYWKVLIRLYQSYFDEDAHVVDTQGHARAAIVSSITSVIDQNARLWIIDPDDESGVALDSRQRGNQAYYVLRDAGWLEESRYGYSDFVTMPPRVNQLLAVLMEISEGRALVMTGKLKSLRSGLRETLNDPENAADLLTEATKDAKRFSRHLGSIRGSIKSLYDQIKGNVPAREIVSAFFDDFLSEIVVRDYATIKTTENPLSIRDELLRIVSFLRYSDEKKEKLLKGYRNLYARDAPENASRYMDQDLNQLETVFLHIENQLDAIDSIKLMYEQRIDTVIAYASRTPRELGRNINRLVQALAKHGETNPDITMAMPFIIGERYGDERFAKPKIPKSPPRPRPLQRRTVSADILNRTAIERTARMLTHVSGTQVVEYLNNQIGHRRTCEIHELTANSLQDYFCLLALQRAGYIYDASNEEFADIIKSFHIAPTNDWIENRFIESRNIILTRKEKSNERR